MLGIAACFWRVFALPDYWIPEGGGDLASTLLPFYSFAASELKSGRLPLWNPYLYGGAPFIADLQTAVFYPLNWPVFLLPQVTYESLQFLVLAHLLLAAAGMYLLCVYGPLPTGRVAAVVAGLAFALCDYMVVHLGNLNLVAGAAWMPWLALAVGRGVMSRRWVPFAFGGLALSMMLLAGHIQPFLYGMLLAALIAAFGVVLAWRENGPRAALGVALRALIVPLVAVGVSAVQLLPGIELRELTARAAVSYDVSIEYSMPPVQLLSLIVPDLFGRGPGSYWAPWPRVEMGYFGILPLFAALAAFWVRRGPFTWFLGALAILGVLMALGGYSIVHGLLFQFVPGFSGLRAPARAIILFNLAAAWLAAVGIDGLLRVDRDPSVKWLLRVGWTFLGIAVLGVLPPVVYYLATVAGQPGPLAIRVGPIANGLVLSGALLALSLAVFGLARRMPGKVAAALILAIVSFDLLTTGFDVEGGGEDPAAKYQHDAVVNFIRENSPEPLRIDTETGVWSVWQPAAGMLHRIGDVRGVDNPLMLADTQRYWAGLGGRQGAPYDLLNVGFALVTPGTPLDPQKFRKVFDGDPEIEVWRYQTPMPRVWVVGSNSVVNDHEAAFAAIHQSSFNPREHVILEEFGVRMGQPGTARIESYTNDRITVRVNAPNNGHLVLSEVWYPGWEATVNGQPTTVLRANYLFRAVNVPVGESLVELVFRPYSFYAGATVSLLTLITLGIALGIGQIRRR